MNLTFSFAEAKVVDGLRVKQAREKALLTQAALAKLAGVSQAMIAHIEQGLKQPSVDLAAKLASSTNVTTDYLFKPSTSILPQGSMLYRARTNISARKFAQAHAIATDVLELFSSLAQRFELPPVRLRPVQSSPAEAAAITRDMLGITEDSPIPHLMRAFEKSGGTLLALPELPGREAFAVWAANRPVIAIGPSTSGDRLRFSTAHEIGHLILHNAPNGKFKAEKEAHQFAAELLMPASAIKLDFSGSISFDKLGQLKRKWGVSMAALLYRARELQLIPKRAHDRLVIELSKFKTQEPAQYDIPIEQPRVLRQMTEVLYSDEAEAKIATEFALTEDFVRDLLSRYASSSDIAMSSRRRKVIPITNSLKVNRPSTPSTLMRRSE